MRKYLNRYGDKFTFSLDENGDILWEGNFEYCTITMPNDYREAHRVYLLDNCFSDHCLSFEDFKNAIHEYDDVKKEYKMGLKYVKLVTSRTDKIDCVDPSGGPYIGVGANMQTFGFKDFIVEDFERIKTGYKIITKKCEYCGKAGETHKMSCPTQKIQINL